MVAYPHDAAAEIDRFERGPSEFIQSLIKRAAAVPASGTKN